MITWLIARFGETGARIILIGLIALAVIIALFTVSRCSRPDDPSPQIEQSTRSADAASNAAQAAVATISNRTVTEQDIDRATVSALENIDNATDAYAVRQSVLDSVCGSPAHRSDPACAVR